MSNESFYPLTSKTLEKLYQANLTAAEWRLWNYLVVTDPWGDNYKDLPDTLIIMEKVGIKKSTFYAAIAKLDKAGLLPDWFEREIYDNPEYQVVKRLETELGGQMEVVTAVGRIDLLTNTEVIEVKEVSDWKAALGQILAYSSFFPEHIKRIHLFGDCTPEKKQVISSTVLSFGVIATFEEVKDEN
jgi:hypothetical protein